MKQEGWDGLGLENCLLPGRIRLLWNKVFPHRAQTLFMENMWSYFTRITLPLSVHEGPFLGSSLWEPAGVLGGETWKVWEPPWMYSIQKPLTFPLDPSSSSKLTLVCSYQVWLQKCQIQVSRLTQYDYLSWFGGDSLCVTFNLWRVPPKKVGGIQGF